jgi:hypothetical protein
VCKLYTGTSCRLSHPNFVRRQTTCCMFHWKGQGIRMSVHVLSVCLSSNSCLPRHTFSLTAECMPCLFVWWGWMYALPVCVFIVFVEQLIILCACVSVLVYFCIWICLLVSDARTTGTYTSTSNAAKQRKKHSCLCLHPPPAHSLWKIYPHFTWQTLIVVYVFVWSSASTHVLLGLWWPVLEW